MAPTWRSNGIAVAVALTNSQPSQVVTGSSTRDSPSGGVSNPGADSNVPSSRYPQPWYGHATARRCAAPPSGSSSWPRCRHTLAKARTAPSLKVSSTPMSPTTSARCVTGPAVSSSARPTQVQPARLVHVHHVSGLEVGDLHVAAQLLRDRQVGDGVLGREMRRTPVEVPARDVHPHVRVGAHRRRQPVGHVDVLPLELLERPREHAAVEDLVR